MPEPDAYKLLQVDCDAELEVVRAAYHVLARRYHPDGHAPDARRMAALNEAYAVLRSPDRRAIYDRSRIQLRSMGPGPTAVRAPAAAAGAPFRTARRAAEDTSSRLPFGRYAGWTIAQLVRYDPNYVRWLARHSAGIRYRTEIKEHLGFEHDLDRRANSVA